MTTGVDAASVLDERFVEFLAWLRTERGRAPATIEAYRRDLVAFDGYLANRRLGVEEVSGADVEQYLGELRADGLAAATMTRRLTAIRSAYRYLVAEDVLDSDPTRQVASPRVPAGLPKALGADEVERLLGSVTGDTAVDRRDLAVLEVLYGSGLRISELVGLSFGDVDLEGRLLRAFGKGRKERIVPLGSLAAAALGAWMEPEGRGALVPARWRSRDDADAVFLNQRGSRLTRQGAWLVVQRRARLVGLGDVVYPHVLRHSCATHMLDGGADLRAVQELLGHASISTTQTYTRVATERLFETYRTAHPRAERGRGS